MLLARNATLPGVGTYSAYTGCTADDLLELVGVRQKEMYKTLLTSPGVQHADHKLQLKHIFGKAEPVVFTNRLKTVNFGHQGVLIFTGLCPIYLTFNCFYVNSYKCL